MYVRTSQLPYLNRIFFVSASAGIRNSKLDQKQTDGTRIAREKDGFKENQHQIWQQSVSEEEK